MKILFTGGTGVVGAGAIPELLQRGHTVRLLSRGATEDAREYPSGVEPFPADVSDPSSLEHAADGCAAVIHVTGIIEERLPEVTFERINVDGTRHVLAEAARAGALKFVYLSSLGAARGQSEYHQSKLRAESLVQAFPGRWLILRPGNVFGPGDDVISTLLKMIRSLPVVPTIAEGRQPFQPLWFEDLAEAIAQSIERDDLSGKTFELAGEEVTSTEDVIARLGAITGRNPPTLRVPQPVANVVAHVAETVVGQKLVENAGFSSPINNAKLQMLIEHNVLEDPKQNALLTVFGIRPTPLDQGLRRLAEELPELLPGDGVGPLERKRFWADIEGGRFTARELFQYFCDEITQLMPIEFSAEPHSPRRVEYGATMTGAIPGRGNIQVRVEELSEEHVTFVTVEGHPLAGLVTFRCVDLPNGVRFLIEIHARAANAVDWLALRAFGGLVQNANWTELVQGVIGCSGGTAPTGVEHDVQSLDGEESGEIDKWVKDLVIERKRREHRHEGSAPELMSQGTATST